jgi:hypothetical protein
MERCVEAEWLDELPAEDPAARGSWRDLRVLNFWMGNARMVSRALNSVSACRQPIRIVELGAGDGHFMLQVARRLGPTWKGKPAVLVDRQRAVDCNTQAALEALGWQFEVVQADVFVWLELSAAEASDAVIANLFAHHFDDLRLATLLHGIARHAQIFVAVEPRRSLWSFVFSQLVGMLGCNRVTRHDAPASVRAGFRGKELSRLWPAPADWFLEERRAGPFSHLFIARRKAQ